MVEVLAAVEEVFMELSSREDFVAKHPEIIEITNTYQDFLGKLYDSQIMN